MSIILKFPLERVQRRSIGNPDTSHNADVYVFEGVRYEKMQVQKSRRKQKKKAQTKA